MPMPTSLNKIRAVLPHTDDIPADAFCAEFPRTSAVGINLDQNGPEELRRNVMPWNGAPAGTLAWAPGLAKSIYDQGRQVVWSVPFPGAGRMEEVNAGLHDDLYIAVANGMVAAIRASVVPVPEAWLRLFWEFDQPANIECRAQDKDGKPNAGLYKKCYRRIAGIMQRVFTREGIPLKLLWCPTIERQVYVDWRLAYPGKAFVDAITPDLYMCYDMGHSPGVYTGNWFRDPLLALRAFCVEKNIPFGLAEAGIDHDDFVADYEMALGDVMACPVGWAIIQVWQDPGVADCRMDAGRQPLTAAMWHRKMEGTAA